MGPASEHNRVHARAGRVTQFDYSDLARTRPHPGPVEPCYVDAFEGSVSALAWASIIAEARIA